MFQGWSGSGERGRQGLDHPVLLRLGQRRVHREGEEALVRAFRYLRGDRAGRAEAEEHGRRAGVPETQLDWPE